MFSSRQYLTVLMAFMMAFITGKLDKIHSNRLICFTAFWKFSFSIQNVDNKLSSLSNVIRGRAFGS